MLASFNWRPVYDIEQRTKQLDLNAIASVRQMRASEKQILESEKRLKLLQESNAITARFEQDSFLLEPKPSTDNSSPT